MARGGLVDDRLPGAGVACAAGGQLDVEGLAVGDEERSRMEFLRGAAKAGERSRPADGNEAEQAQDTDDLAGVESEATAGLAEEVA